MKAHEREKLKDQVMSMIVTGYTHREIARSLGITERTIINYVHSRTDEAIKEMRGNVDEQIAAMEINKKKRIKELWTIVIDPVSKTKDKSKALQLLQNEEVLDIKRRQLVGYLPPEAPAVAIQNTNVVEGSTTIADSIRRLHPELIEKFTMNKARLINDRQENPQGDKTELVGPIKEN